MLTLKQLEDDTFKLEVMHKNECLDIHYEMYFKECEPSEAKEKRIILSAKLDNDALG